MSYLVQGQHPLPLGLNPNVYYHSGSYGPGVNPPGYAYVPPYYPANLNGPQPLNNGQGLITRSISWPGIRHYLTRARHRTAFPRRSCFRRAFRGPRPWQRLRWAPETYSGYRHVDDAWRGHAWPGFHHPHSGHSHAWMPGSYSSPGFNPSGYGGWNMGLGGPYSPAYVIYGTSGAEDWDSSDTDSDGSGDDGSEDSEGTEDDDDVSY
ncbi:hypothetical protein K488DRAFT_73104 [Vararia minispora EC-137]|uniref:Uncharacterized protein n=1 Tax=Vararia minispora EC-137 TaxID=1314806 RepID=A0ACB8QCD5_9AGAM|nr:hypothetical protein K488DRAFT_73104 [Vararia minispora EC-137]